MKKMNFNLLNILLNSIGLTLNEGGTFTLEELIEEFQKCENLSMINNLKNDAIYLNGLLCKEDWEIQKSILDYILKMARKNSVK